MDRNCYDDEARYGDRKRDADIVAIDKMVRHGKWGG